MSEKKSLPIGQKVSLPGHFDVPVTLVDVRILENGFECLVRLPDGSLDETTISVEEANYLIKPTEEKPNTLTPVVWDPLENLDAEPIRIQNPAQKLDHLKREILEKRFYEIRAEAIKINQEKGN